ncbi:hypothetical protein ABT187_43585 [Streptomyces sp. NPDC001817]|uniref:hypothetical protein n=1 Tax=Streptomyces sp. NPDC001817 TaxID=3154398 RepID=UPI00331E1E51
MAWWSTVLVSQAGPDKFACWGTVGPDSCRAGTPAVAPLLPRLGRVFAKTAILVGACVEWSGSPMVQTPVLPRRAAEAFRLWAQVPTMGETAMPRARY